MLIKDIPFVKVRERAYEHRCYNIDSLQGAFFWSETSEDYVFWEAVDNADWDLVRELQPGLFIYDVPVDYREILKEVLIHNDVSRLHLSETAQLELQKIAEEIVIESANT